MSDSAQERARAAAVDAVYRAKLRKAEYEERTSTPSANAIASEVYGLWGFDERAPEATEDVWYRLVEAVEIGNYDHTAAKTVGITPRKLKRWRHEGAKDIEDDLDTPLGRLHALMSRAEAASEMYAVTCLRKHMARDWRAAESYLKHRAPQRWGTRTAIEVDIGAKKTAAQPMRERLGDERTRQLGRVAALMARPSPAVVVEVEAALEEVEVDDG